MKDRITWKIGGEAGFGIMSSGIMLSRIFSRMGYHVIATNEYPSLIRGGHNLVTVRIGTEVFHSLNRNLDILAGLNAKSIALHMQEVHDGTVILFDPSDREWNPGDFPTKPVLVPVPLSKITKTFGGELVMRNTVATAATLAVLGAPFEAMETMLRDLFGSKGEEVVKQNIDVAKAGYDHVMESHPELDGMHLSPAEKRGEQLIVNGSEAVGIASLRAGLQFAAIYPMTPINALITFLTQYGPKYNVVYKQPEDEIAGIMMAIGASIAGARSMVATSGGGFALMVEGLSLAGMTEVPLVIDLGMRVGPATGMPTWTEAGELRFVIHAGHGEFPRIVLAPGDADETFELTVQAYNLADRYQVPVFILTDKYLNESSWTVSSELYASQVAIDRGKLIAEDIDGEYKRYDPGTEDGVSQRAMPGVKNGFHINSSYEHDEHGLVTDDPANRKRMVDKRLRKAQAIAAAAMPPSVYGDQDADITFVDWGTTKGPILEAMKMLKEKGVTSRLIHFSWVYPFPDAAKELLSGAKRLVLVEQNATAQLGSLIREFAGIEIGEKILKYDGRPLYPEEIVERMAL